MKLEFLDNISDGGRFTGVVTEQLIRLYDFDKLQAGKLKNHIQEEMIEQGNHLNLSGLDFIEGVNCTLLLRIAEADLGITRISRSRFVCDLTVNGYKEMCRLLEPFCIKDSRGYQWLYDLDTPIEFLFSSGGTH